MEKKHRPLDLSEINNTTSSRAELLLSLSNMVEDTKKEERKKAQLCRICYYRKGIGGAAMTTWYCGLCGKEDLASSTNTDRLCKRCAEEHNLCAHCGGDLELKLRRKL